MIILYHRREYTMSGKNSGNDDICEEEEREEFYMDRSVSSENDSKINMLIRKL